MRNILSVILTLSLCLFITTSVIAQDNTFDLRPVEVNSNGEITYQNFIYARTFANGQFMAEGWYAHMPEYNEYSAGIGYNVAGFGDCRVYGLAHYTIATDDNYVLPGIFILDINGKWTGSLWGVYYYPLGNSGIDQILVDPAEIQYNLTGPWSVGISAYAWKMQGSDLNLKIGPKISLADKYGATELRAAKWNEAGGGGWEFQLRRIVVF
jgi:hypothetical protein